MYGPSPIENSDGNLDCPPVSIVTFLNSGEALSALRLKSESKAGIAICRPSSIKTIINNVNMMLAINSFFSLLFLMEIPP